MYKKDKLYYGFNAICYLSNGNPRTFINLCRAIISDACFFEKDNFLETGIISKEIQSKAIHNFSKSEFDGICSIIDYGKNIRTFILNIGNYFSFYHKDKKLRYPETNQFYFDELCLFENDREIIKTALSWSMIIRKKKTQRLTAGNNKKGDLYQINKIFNPIFNISYRTRGGFNLPFNNKDIHNMLNEIVTPNIVTNNVTQSSSIQKNKNSNDKQLSLFDVEGFSDEN